MAGAADSPVVALEVAEVLEARAVRRQALIRRQAALQVVAEEAADCLAAALARS